MQSNKNIINPQADKKLKLYRFLNLSKNIVIVYKKKGGGNNEYMDLNHSNQYREYHKLCLVKSQPKIVIQP